MTTNIISELLKQNEFNIYEKEICDSEKFESIAKMISESTIKISEIFDFNKFLHKFCWANAIKIINHLDESRKNESIYFLFELLQDMNWPVFEEAIETLLKYERKELKLNIEKYLIIAEEECDELWLEGIRVLVKRMS